MSLEGTTLNHDILLEVFGHLSIAQSIFASSLLPHHYYWGPLPSAEWKEAMEDSTKHQMMCISERRQALLNSALVCKAWHEPALDELWAAPRGGLYAILRLLSCVTTEDFEEYCALISSYVRTPCLWMNFSLTSVSDHWRTNRR